MNISILIIFLFLSFFIESTFVAAPLVFAFSLLIFRKLLIIIHTDEKNHRIENAIPNTILLVGSLAGLLVAGFISDAGRLSHPGFTPLALFITFLIVHLYTKLYELESSRLFVVLFFITVLLYSFIAEFELIQTLQMLLVFIVARIFLYLVHIKYGKNWSRIS